MGKLPLVLSPRSSKKLSVFAWLRLLRSKSSAKKAMHAHNVTLQSILVMSF